MARASDSIERDFYGARDSLDGLMAAATRTVEANVKVHGASMWTHASLHVLLERLQRPRAAMRGVSVVQGDLPLVIVKRPALGSRGLSPVMQLVLVRHSEGPLVSMFGCQSRDDFSHAAGLLHDCLTPIVARPYIQTSQFRDMLSAISRSTLTPSARVRECVSKGLIDDVESYKRVKTNRAWTDDDFRVVFDQLREQEEWVSSLLIETRGSVRCTARLHRDASFACERNWDGFVNAIFRRYQLLLLDMLGFFENRGRDSSPTGTVRPVVIKYSRAVFGDARSNARLVRVLDGLPDSSLSVFHQAPYLHAAIVDYVDGSIYTLWVASENAVLVVPGERATPESLQRLCNRICDDFEEGELLEFGNSQAA